MELTAQNVDAVIKDCLYRDEEISDGQPPEGCVIAEGIMLKAGFHPVRLEARRADVASLLAQLPEKFNQSTTNGGGGGWSFLGACARRDGVQWGEQRDMDALFTLGQALGLVRECMPGMASILPGGVPYYVILDEGGAP